MPKPAAQALPEAVTAGQIARLAGVSERVINGRKADGRLPVLPDGRVDLVSVVRAGIAALAEQQRGEGAGALDRARIEVLQQQRDRLAMLNAQLRGDLITAEDMEAVVGAMFDAVRTKLLALPTKLAPIVLNLPSAMDVRERLTDGVHECLSDLATHDVVADIQDRTRRRAGLHEPEDEAPAETAGHA